MTMHPSASTTVSGSFPAQVGKIASLIVLAGACVLPPALAATQEGYPSRAVTLVVPYPPGGSTDMIAREYADRMSKELGQSVVVENRPGAATNIGGAAVARADPDGYTLLFGGNGLIINPIFGPKPSFDGANAFAPVSMIAEVPFIVAANADAPFSTPQEMIKAAQAKPGAITISSAQLHLYVEYLKARSKMDLLHVPYKGGAASVTDAIAGQVDSVFALTPVVLPHVKAKTLKPIAVTSDERVTVLPNIPTFKESGVDYVVTIWYGIFAPKGTPDDIIKRLGEATKKVAKSKELIDKLAQSGVRLRTTSPAGLSDIVDDQVEEWEAVAKAMPQLIRTEASK